MFRIIKKCIKPFVPRWLHKRYSHQRHTLHYRKIGRDRAARDSIRSAREVFSEIYQDNLWGGKDGELFSGLGSRFAPAERYVGVILEFIKRNKITSVVDLGCGDFEIGRHIAPACASYIGVDVVPAVIENNQKKYGNKHTRFECLDIAEDILPDAQLCLIRQVLQHLSNKEIIDVLTKARKYKHLIVTEHFPNKITSINKDKVHGFGTRVEENSAVFLAEPPFNAAALDLLLEVRAVILNQSGEPEECPEMGTIRSYRVTLDRPM